MARLCNETLFTNSLYGVEPGGDEEVRGHSRILVSMTFAGREMKCPESLVQTFLETEKPMESIYNSPVD